MSLFVEGVSKSFGPKPILHDVDLVLEKGETGAILGPSGAGKSTLLALIAGLEKPSRGVIRWAEAVWDNGSVHVPTERRSVGMVFQDLALFPHLTVSQNIAFGLKVGRSDRAFQERRVDELLRLVRLEGLGTRYPHQISGGQKQRVALARALAVNPRIVLFDESLSSLDAKLREEIRAELKELLSQLKMTALFVTHDPVEAMTLADRLFVMKDGRMLAAGPPEELYRHPPSKDIAETLGPGSFLPVEVLPGGATETHLKVRNLSVRVALPSPPPGAYTFVLRPTSSRLVVTPGPDTLSGRVENVLFMGDHYMFEVRFETNLRILIATGQRPAEYVNIAFDPASVHFIPALPPGEMPGTTKQAPLKRQGGSL